MSDWGAWAIGLAGGALLALGWLWRRAEGRVARLAEQREQLESRCRELEASVERGEKARQRQAEELSSFRRKADKTRKRESRASPLPLGTAARVQDLEAALARSERDRLRAERECERLEQERSRLEGLLAVRARAPMPPPPPPAAAAIGSELPATRAAVPASVEGISADELEARVEAAQAADRKRISELEEALASRERDGARLKKRIANQEQLYAAVRAELALKKDRLRAQEEQIERLQALQVTLVD